jgi:hypothetical protein
MEFITAENYAIDLAFVAALLAGVMLMCGTKRRWPYCLAAALFGLSIGTYLGIYATTTGHVTRLPLWVLQKNLVETWGFAPEKVMRSEDFQDCADRKAGGMAAEFGTVTMCPEDFKRPNH